MLQKLNISNINQNVMKAILSLEWIDADTKSKIAFFSIYEWIFLWSVALGATYVLSIFMIRVIATDWYIINMAITLMIFVAVYCMIEKCVSYQIVHGFKSSMNKRIEWFDLCANIDPDAIHLKHEELHELSMWGYMSYHEWETYSMKAISYFTKPIQSNHIIFEAGCGTGAFVHILYKHIPNIKIHGVDLSESAINIINHFTFNNVSNFKETFMFKRGNVCDMKDIQNNKYDYYIANAVTCYLENIQNVDLMLKESIRVTKKFGFMLFTALTDPTRANHRYTSSHNVEISIDDFWKAKQHQFGYKVLNVVWQNLWGPQQDNKYAIYLQKI